MGMHTVITAGGATLSGGQRQRLMIARAVVAKPRLMLFDEATSALDNRTQETVSKNLEVLHTTRIVIAHRLSTIRRADLVLRVGWWPAGAERRLRRTAEPARSLRGPGQAPVGLTGGGQRGTQVGA